MLRLLVADDDPLVRAGIAVLCRREADIEVVAEAADGLEAVALAERLRPTVVLMDLRMPVIDGVEATRRIRAFADPPAVLVLTTFDDGELVDDALAAGSAGYLTKDATPEQIAEGVRVAASGGAWLSSRVAHRVLANAASTGQRRRALVAAGSQLSDREREVLALLAAGRSNAEIAAALQLGTATVKTHVAGVLAKLGARDRLQAVAMAHELGQRGTQRHEPAEGPPGG